MKKILFILLFMFIALPVIADVSWETFTNKNKTFYIDTTSMTKNGTQYTYWIKTENNNGYKKMFILSDCSNNTTGVQKILTYDKNDKLIKTTNVNQDLSVIVPESDSYAAYNYICDIYKKAEEKENKKNNAITAKKVFSTINSINNAGYELKSIKSNAQSILNEF